MYINKFISALKKQGWAEARIAGRIAHIYNMANIPDQVEKYYRKALSLEPDNPARINTLAYILIDNERNIGEGMELLEKVLEKNPDDFSSLGVKGWGLYKQGRYREALDVLQKTWDLRMKQSFITIRILFILRKRKRLLQI